MKKQVLCVLLSILGILTSCTDTSSTSSVQMNPDEIKDVKSALEYMKSSYNFQVITQDTTNINLEYYLAYYTPNYYVGKLDGDESYYTGYIQFQNGVSRISIPYGQEEGEEEVSASEILFSDSSLYNNNVTKNLSALDTNNFESGLETIKTKKKSDVVAILNVIGFSQSTYMSLLNNEIELTYSNNTLIIDFTIMQGETGIEYESLIENFGVTDFELIDDFITDGGTPFVPDSSISKIRELFKNNNYIREETNDEGEYTVREYFNPQYYFNDISADYLKEYPTLASYYLGYIKIKKENIAIDEYPTLTYDDVYLFYPVNRAGIQLVTRENPNKAGYAQGAFTTKQDDLAYVMNYPSNLVLWSSLERFTLENGTYSTYDYEIIGDFISNFGITSSEETTLYAKSLDFVFDIDETAESNTTAEFILNCEDQNGTEVIYSMKFNSFGEANYEPVESFLDDYELRLEE